MTEAQSLSREDSLQLKRIPVKPHPRAYHRAYLGGLLSSHFDTPLVVIEAPEGYGKTTLLTSVMHRAEAQVRWLSLDAGDSSLNAFVASLCATLYALPVITDQPIVSANDVAGALRLVVSAIRELGVDTVILDNFETVSHSQIINQFLEQAAPELPPTTQLVVATSKSPTFKRGARMRARMLEISASDLCFDTEDVVGYFETVGRYAISPADASLIVERTGGQPAAVNLLLQIAFGLPSYLRINFEALLGPPTDDISTVSFLREILKRLPFPLEATVAAVKSLSSGESRDPLSSAPSLRDEVLRFLAVSNCLVHQLDAPEFPTVPHRMLSQLAENL